MTDKNRTELAIIMDRSGSMASIRDDMVGGFARFIDDQKQAPGELSVSLYQFDDTFDVVFEEKPGAEVSEIKLMPRGSTALLDAVGKAVALIGERLAKKPESERPGAVVVLVITDGQENASREFKAKQVRNLIEQQEREYNWKFAYLGSDPSGFAESADYGFTRAASYQNTSKGVQDMYAGTSEALRSYRHDVSNNVAGAELNIGKK